MSTPSEPTTEFPARFHDGLTAAAIPATVSAESRGLVLRGDDGGVIDCWAWDDIQLTEQPTPDRPVRLSHQSKPGARLVIEESAILPRIEAHARYLHRRPINPRHVWSAIGIAAAGVATFVFFVYGLPWIARPASKLVPVSWEEPVGDSTVEIVNKLFANGRKMCIGEAGSAALRSMTKALAATVDSPYRVQVHVVDSKIVNALATPGGRIVLFRGLIDKAGAADEVAGVLAHEMAHVVRRHPTQSMITSIGWSALLSAFTGGASLSNAAVAELAAHLATSAYDRDIETEADSDAVAMLNAAGIGSAGLERFFRSVAELEKKGLQLPEYLSSHPSASRRIEVVRNSGSMQGTPALSEPEWQALKAICK
jgi:Zn-dependent protease with chaperone function